MPRNSAIYLDKNGIIILSIEDVMSRLDPKTRSRVQAAQDVEVHKLKTPSAGLTLALNGGLAYGRQVLVWGNKSAGKSSFCQQLIGIAQQEGKVCAWIDGEQSWDPSWAARMGADPSEVIHSPVKSINDMVDVGTKLIKAGVDVMVIDSISSLLPAVYFEKDGNELKDLVDTKQIGAEARDMTNAVKMLNYVNEKTLLILISQQRNKIGLFTQQIPTGGEAVKFFSSTVIKLWSSEANDKQIKGEVQSGDRLFEEKIGRPVNWTVEYNKTGPQNLTGEYDFYYQGDHVGIDYVGEIVGMARKYDIITGKTWLDVYGKSIQGEKNAIKYLREEKDIFARVEGDVLGKLK